MVYFISTACERYIKIGFSQNSERRLVERTMDYDVTGWITQSLS